VPTGPRNPQEAYDAALQRRKEKAQFAGDDADTQRTLPLRAEAKLSEIGSRLEAEMLAGLQLDAKMTPGGTLDNRGSGHRGVKALYLKVFENGSVVAEGTIGVADDESAELIEFTNNPVGATFRKTTLADLNPEIASAFLTYMISRIN
jgi:hypothetical protein